MDSGQEHQADVESELDDRLQDIESRLTNLEVVVGRLARAWALSRRQQRADRFADDDCDRD